MLYEVITDKQISAMSLVCQVCVDEAHNCDEVYIQEVFLKAGIFKIFDMTKKKLFKINREINEKYQYMYKAIITNDLAQLDKYITDTQYNKIDQAFLCLYLGRIVITSYSIHYTTLYEMKSYPMTKEMIADKLNPSPNEIWKWGVKNRGCDGIRPDLDFTRYILTEEKNGSITPRGVCYKDIYYTSANNDENILGWYSNARANGRT